MSWLRRRFARATGAGLFGAVLVALAGNSTAYDENPPTIFDSSAYNWTTMSEGNSFAAPTMQARLMLSGASPVFDQVFRNSALLFMPAQDSAAGTYKKAQFQVAEDIPFIKLYKNELAPALNHAVMSRAHKGEPDTPSYEEFLTADIALSIANESAHFWQNRANPQLLETLHKEGLPCADKMALEMSSDEVMVSAGAAMHKNATAENTPAARRMKNAIEWAMEAQEFYNFGDYAANPQSPESKEALKAFIGKRLETYTKNNACTLEQAKAPASGETAKALRGIPSLAR